MYSNILLPLDGSPLSEAAIADAAQVAAAFRSRLTLLHIIESITVAPQPGFFGPVITVPGDMAAERENAVKYLEGKAAEMRADGIDVRTEVLEGDAASAICDFAAEKGIDLIIMSTHGRSGVRRWVYGSVAARVLRASRSPVLLVRAHKDTDRPAGVG